MTAEDKKAIDEAAEWMAQAAKHTPPAHGEIQVTVQYRNGKVQLIHRDVRESRKPQKT